MLFFSVLLDAPDTVLIERAGGKRIDPITGGGFGLGGLCSLSEIWAWISNCITQDVITHPCSYFNCSFADLQLKLGNRWVILWYILAKMTTKYWRVPRDEQCFEVPVISFLQMFTTQRLIGLKTTKSLVALSPPRDMRKTPWWRNSWFTTDIFLASSVVSILTRKPSTPTSPRPMCFYKVAYQSWYRWLSARLQ